MVFTWGDEDVQLAVITLTFAEHDGGAAHLPSCPPRGHGHRPSGLEEDWNECLDSLERFLASRVEQL